MVAALEDTSPLQRPEIGNILDDTDQAGVACLIAAHHTRVLRIQVATGGTGVDLLGGIFERDRERTHQGLALLQVLQHRTARGAWPQSRKPSQDLDQALDFGARHRVQNGSLRPCGSDMPPVIFCISAAAC